jgi:hypothetical protein
MAVPISSIALASEYVLTPGWVGGVRPTVCPFGRGALMRKLALELSGFIMTQSPSEQNADSQRQPTPKQCNRDHAAPGFSALEGGARRTTLDAFGAV